jgi:hypothetical protein
MPSEAELRSVLTSVITDPKEQGATSDDEGPLTPRHSGQAGTSDHEEPQEDQSKYFKAE